jgi:hypothetical protein
MDEKLRERQGVRLADCEVESRRARRPHPSPSRSSSSLRGQPSNTEIYQQKQSKNNIAKVAGKTVATQKSSTGEKLHLIA